jgi:protein TonB
MFIGRLSFSLAGAAPIAFGLLFLMQLLITIGESPIKPVSGPLIELLEVRVDTDVTPTIKPPEPPPTVEPPPSRPIINQQAQAGNVVVVAPPTIAVDPIQEIQSMIIDGDALPVSRVAPLYPQRAQRRGLEGFVVLEFTVTKTGSVRDVKVIESSNAVFERSAMNAIQKFKYRPRIIAGEPVEVSGIQFKLSFALED